ncbi:MAG TPA: aminotransferase class IV [Petrotogaceae bacterium]|nr:aminotransferase class IV family protein [Petrotogaceae bacterium]HNY36679.1 aminotransferase class IV [Petrotogaceae bacterium]HOG34030.1 aminotransferase class IV [Petrotogaceae bacterium]HPA92697.1 aminotransferase class IV [Petrotogaceae bacterium]HPX16222.1 aminotransferase class IV [Petrotogaceae bacterium]
MFYNGLEWLEYPLIVGDDPGFMRGYSVYEVVRTYAKAPFGLKKHYERLKKSADFLGIEVPEYSDILRVMNEAMTIHDFSEYRFRLYITPGTSKKKTFYCYVEEIKENHDLTDSGVVINIARERKPVSPVIPYYVKSPLNGYGEYLRRKYDYYYDTLLINEFGYVTECTMSNIFLVSQGVLITPSLKSGILPGITRENILMLASKLSIEVEERNVEIWELLSAEEVFISHTSRGIVPVRRIIPDFTFSVPGVMTETFISNWADLVLKDPSNWEGF